MVHLQIRHDELTVLQLMCCVSWNREKAVSVDDVGTCWDAGKLFLAVVVYIMYVLLRALANLNPDWRQTHIHILKPNILHAVSTQAQQQLHFC